MAIPTYTDLMLPLLRLCAEHEWRMRDLIGRIADDLGLSADERALQYPSGGATIIGSRVHWAKTYLKQAGLLAQPARAVVRITERGREILDNPPPAIDGRFLETFPEFRAFVARKGGSRVEGTTADSDNDGQASTPTATPQERIDIAARELTGSLRESLLARVVESSPMFFEKLILDLLLAMGYGGSRQDAGEHMGRSGDGGIDGMIREDQLGLDRIYLQAK